MKTTRRTFIKKSSLIGTSLSLGTIPFNLSAQSAESPIKIGIIGLDTSHAPAFTKLFNAPDPSPELAGMKVVAAYPFGSKTIKSSTDRIEGYIEQVKLLGVEITDSIEALLEKVDVVLLETNDGKPHLEQARAVFKAKKPVFIDKPVAGTFQDVKTIYQEAEAAGIPIFSASSLRYQKNVHAVRHENAVGKVLGCDAYSPATLEPSHPDLFWYGIHGVEILFTAMGPGCQYVTRFSSGETEVVVGTWKDGRIGTFRGMRAGKHDYGGTAFGTDGNLFFGEYDGYEPLAMQIAAFFRSKKSPVDAEETLEIYAFMEAADVSKRNGGQAVALEPFLKG